MGRTTMSVSGVFSAEDADSIAKALVAGDDDLVRRLVEESTPPKGIDPEAVRQAARHRTICGDCSCGASGLVKTCDHQVLVERPDGTSNWVTTSVTLEYCAEGLLGMLGNWACFAARRLSR